MKFSVNNLDHKDVWIRAAKTFTVTFVAVFLAGLTDLYNSFTANGSAAGKAALVGLSVSAFAAAITAIWNYVIQGMNSGK